MKPPVIASAAIATWAAATLLAAPVRPSLDADTESPPDDLVCELGAEPSPEAVDPHRWSGRFGGIGIQIRAGTDNLGIEEAFKDGPAAKAGIGKGDQILRIGDTPTTGLSLSETVTRLRGEPGSTVTLTVLHPAAGKTRVVQLQRAFVKVISVRNPRVLAGKVGYLRITGFNQFTGPDTREAIEELLKKGACAWVLDLRSNTGGPLRAAREVAGRFLEPAQPAFILQLDPPPQRREFFASRFGPRANGPLAVLVNAGTAGAAEVLAGALRIGRRATLVGSKTAGHNRVLQLMPLPGGTAALIERGECLLPDGGGFAQRGVLPDVMLDADNGPVVWQRAWDTSAPDPADDRVLQRAVGLCLEKLGQPPQ
ncbi:MAG: PDZ domain-containing protein [Verrucomicrobia bacterium]|nr:PDZ domain-containing protein [Verrucomicrobiota bacterium]